MTFSMVDQTPPCAEGDAAQRRASPSQLDLLVFYSMFATGSASALLGVGAADAGLAPLLGPVQVEEDAADDG